MQDKMEEVIAGVPYLKDIPFFGKVFRQTRQKTTKNELVILLRPTLLNEQQMINLLNDTYNNFDKLDKGFHLGGNIDLYGTMAEKE